jgi:leucyl aminopeptidase
MEFLINNNQSLTNVIFIDQYQNLLCSSDLDEFSKKSLAYIQSQNKYEGKLYSIGFVSNPTANENLIFVGIGNLNSISREELRRCGNKLFKFCNDMNISDFNINWSSKSVDDDILLSDILIGFGLSNYSFNKLKQEDTISKFKYISIKTEDDSLKTNIAETKLLLESIYHTRDLVNSPSNLQTPSNLADECLRLGQQYGFDVDIIDEDDIKALKMDSFYAVGQGSPNNSKLILLRYNGNRTNPQKLGLIGKSVTFDSGGLHLKHGARMNTMKHDMAGGATVVGAMCAIAKSKLALNVVGILPACENLISASAYKPGDIISSMAGKTFEIHSTDAEGRLTLVDAITFAIRNENVDAIIDLATLTGAARMIFGAYACPIASNHSKLATHLQSISQSTGELMFQIPLLEDCLDDIRGDISDYKNTVKGGTCGMINSSLILREFVENKPWIHIDAAGTMWLDKDMYYNTRGGSGWGVRTLYYFLKSIQGDALKSML